MDWLPQPPSRQPHPADDRFTAFFAVLSLFAAGVALGGMAGQWSHALSAIGLVLPAVVIAAWFYRRRVASIVALGGMAAWGVTREITTTEPVWSILTTFLISLFILCVTGWLIDLLLTARESATHFSRTEPLTGLLNRNAFLETLQVEVDRSRRRGHSLAVAFLDCDNFKELNDTRGHLAGDELLKVIGATLQSGTRSYDVVARMGGDEFAILFPDTLVTDAESVARRLHDELRKELTRRQLPVTLSIGLVAFESPPADAREVIDAADGLMYHAKSDGKDRLVTQVVRQESPSASTHS